MSYSPSYIDISFIQDSPTIKCQGALAPVRPDVSSVFQVALGSVPEAVAVSLHLFARRRGIFKGDILASLDIVNIATIRVHGDAVADAIVTTATATAEERACL